MRRGIVVDLFAGGGGASAGLETALGRKVDVAINHSPVALAVHKANHPGTRHLATDIWDVRPRDATGGRPVDVLWASPDCTHFSVAKGGTPRDHGTRSLAWVVVEWAREVRPAVIFLENVAEFRGWGPLGPDNRADKARAGETFAQWRGALEILGYQVDHRVLDASQFGAPTKRKRLFLVARCDGQPIRWPVPTHGAGLRPLHTAAECIDWTLPCPSIFERQRPLADKTLWRIAQGIRRFVLEAAEPFIIKVNHGRREEREERGEQMPVGTLMGGGQKHALVTAFLAKHFGGDRPGRPGVPLSEPAATITAQDHHSLAAVALAKFRGTGPGYPGAASVEDPLPTVSAGGVHIAEVRAFLTAYYGSGGAGAVDDPLRTITAKHRLGLVTVEGVGYQIVVDIGMRMLQPSELLRAQFGRFAACYDLSAAKTKAGQVRLIGNSVCPEVAEALVRANIPGAERRAA